MNTMTFLNEQPINEHPSAKGVKDLFSPLGCGTARLALPLVKEVENKQEMRRYADQVWRILEAGYAQVKGGLHYGSLEELIDSSALWDVAVQGGQVLAVTVFKAKRGLKLVAMSLDRAFGEVAKCALQKMVRFRLSMCWMELSGAAERFVMKYCDGERYRLAAAHATELLGKAVRLSHDGFHYSREIMGIEKEKIAIGTPDLIGVSVATLKAA